MRAAISGLTAAFFALAGLSVCPAGAQAQTFNFQVCNQSSVPASVSVSNLSAVGSNQFVVQGWWTVNAGTCSMLGNFPQGWFYFYAEQTNSGAIVWGGTGLALCVQYPGPYERTNTSGFTCAPNELKGFNAELIPNTTGTFTWTLN